MLTLIRDALVCAPEKLGRQDVLLAAGKILAIAPHIDQIPNWAPVEQVDAGGRLLTPGLIDLHVHLIGGGGEMGPRSRCPEANLTTLTTAGITTVVGVMGTDSQTRYLSTLLAKVRALELDGLTAYMYTGAYHVPSPTMTGSIRDDLLLIDKVVGVKVAVSDHRSTQPTFEELSKIAAEARIGGMIAGKPGLVHVHVGGGLRGLGPLREVVDRTEIPIGQFLPTHLLRDQKLLEQALEWVSQGGFADFTTSTGNPAAKPFGPRNALKRMLASGLDTRRTTWSTDGHGSLPRFDPATGKAIGLKVGKPDSLLEEVRRAVLEEEIDLADALAPVTVNPAARLSLEGSKGKIAQGHDADLLLLDPKTLVLDSLWAKGKRMIAQGKPISFGMFEEPA